MKMPGNRIDNTFAGQHEHVGNALNGDTEGNERRANKERQQLQQVDQVHTGGAVRARAQRPGLHAGSLRRHRRSEGK